MFREVSESVVLRRSFCGVCCRVWKKMLSV